MSSLLSFKGKNDQNQPEAVIDRVCPGISNWPNAVTPFMYTTAHR